MTWLIASIICGVLAAVIASSKGRSIAVWLLVGFFFGIFGILICAFMSNLKEEKARQHREAMERRRLREQLRQERLKSEAFRQYSLNRLDAHDNALGMDSRAQQNVLGMDERARQSLPDGRTDASLPRETEDLSSMTISQATAALQRMERGEIATPPADQDAAGPGARIPIDVGTLWYYERQGQSVGPVSELELKHMLNAKQLGADTLIWSEGLVDWTPASQLPGMLGAR